MPFHRDQSTIFVRSNHNLFQFRNWITNDLLVGHFDPEKERNERMPPEDVSRCATSTYIYPLRNTPDNILKSCAKPSPM